MNKYLNLKSHNWSQLLTSLRQTRSKKGVRGAALMLACTVLLTMFAVFPAHAEELPIFPERLGTYSTKSTNTANGTSNMAVALGSINGTKLDPGATFSFNGTIGKTTAARGYKSANAIVNGRLVPSMGGGICQASTTLYGAVLRSGLKIVTRQNHSIQSTYCPIGQDAMVSQPDQDFRFQNNTGYPIYIEAGVSSNVLAVTIYGHKSDTYDRIEIKSWKTETIPAPSGVRYVTDSSLQNGQQKFASNARAGARAAAQRVFYKEGKAVSTEQLPSSYYPPEKAIYLVGP